MVWLLFWCLYFTVYRWQSPIVDAWKEVISVMGEEWVDKEELSFNPVHHESAANKPTVIRHGGVKDGELQIYFNPKRHLPEEEAVCASLTALAFRFECTGYNLTRFHAGEIRVFFNPTIHNEANEQEVLGGIMPLIQKD